MTRTLLAATLVAAVLSAPTHADAASRLCHAVNLYRGDTWVAGHVFATPAEAGSYAAKHAGAGVIAEIAFNLDCAGTPAK